MSDTLQEAKQYLRDNWHKGVNCKCCGQFVKLYKRKFGSLQAQALIMMYQLHQESEWVHVREIIEKLNIHGDFSKMAYWKLIEEKENTSSDKKNSGYWKITEIGKQFVLNSIEIPSHVFVYNAKLQGYSETKTNIVKSLGEKFSYKELMNNLNETV